MLTNQIILLKEVSMNGSLFILRKRGLSNSQIALLIKNQIDDGNLEISDDEIKLTKLGEALLGEQIKLLNLRTKDTWILPQDYFYKEPIPKDEILLPKNI